jgi:DNA repair protein RadC
MNRPQTTAKKTPKPIPAEIRVLSTLPANTPISCDGPAEIAHYFREHVTTSPRFHPEKEQLVVILLNTRLKARGFEIICTGSDSQAHFKMRDVMRPVIASGANQFVLLHNHPSGDPKPSQTDTTITRKICEVAKQLETTLLDHVIMGEGTSFYSHRDAGLI